MKKKICFVVTTPLVIQPFYKNKIRFMVNEGYEVTFVAPKGEGHEIIQEEGGRSVYIEMAREPNFLKDLISLVKLWFFFIFNRFDIVSVSTPKASFLGMIAARGAFQKRVIYLIRGRAYENSTGLKRRAYSFLDKLTCFLSTKSISVSHELGDRYIAEGLCPKGKMIVLGKGSCTGVDLDVFNPEKFQMSFKNNKKNKLKIPKDAYVFLYCGRICREKGVNELLHAYKLFLKKYPEDKIYLLLVGRHEMERDPIDQDLYKYTQSTETIINVDWTFSVEEYMAISNVLLFPSYREGFGNIAIEASAMKLPIISTQVVGCRESIEHLETGLLVPPKDENALFEAMRTLYTDQETARNFGVQGRSRVEKYFSTRVVWGNMVNFYNNLLKR